MASNKWQRVIAVVCAASFLVTSCSTLNRVSIPGAETTAALPAVKVGDSVVITTKTGDEKSFKVTAVEADALVGKSVRVLYTDMASLGVKRTHAGKTALTVGLIVLGILVLVGLEATDDALDDTIDMIPN